MIFMAHIGFPERLFFIFRAPGSPVCPPVLSWRLPVDVQSFTSRLRQKDERVPVQPNKHETHIHTGP